ncbi:MAG TPA: hypothetical protein VHY22_00545 [Chthoniobacteraceae bacterium]|nr:hypothetical protein [Chthoniobacteraceae bacterium]
MAAPGDDGLPFADHAPDALVQIECAGFLGGEPAQGPALPADDRLRPFRSDEHVPDVVMKVGGIAAVGGDGMDIEIERTLGGEDKALDARFLQGLPPGHAQDIVIPIAMAAKLHPAIELPVMMKEGLRSVRIYHHAAAGEMSGKGGALETGWRPVEQGDHFFPGLNLPGTVREIESFQLRAEGFAVHGTHLSGENRRAPTSNRRNQNSPW